MTAPAADPMTCRCGDVCLGVVDLLNHCRLMHPDVDVDPVEDDTADATAPTTGGPIDYDGEFYRPEGCVCYFREDPEYGTILIPLRGVPCSVHTPWAFPGYTLDVERTSTHWATAGQPVESNAALEGRMGLPPGRLDEILTEIAQGLDLPPGVALAWDVTPLVPGIEWPARPST